ncbi:hypothetical protein COCSADRAFT_192205 [Bipolaris sorokiniana ND90Pr]|uniref:Uncharacterized protein n=1 Tax=Cochliobolus sativus (strain ND90Pr / ATCC 201652) TaxID=665912 RepID=M2SZ06_COCSN|nr:uncharacterized protein COCSADRAFT_192205 [Bipolaris sorokiniana ND90Pr]EMD62176.1 hypothetical protein COCSADRAFT_192205 [Bipolaris sorokiniana ND90Pr]
MTAVTNSLPIRPLPAKRGKASHLHVEASSSSMLALSTKDVRPHANQPSIPIRHQALPPARLCQVSTLTHTRSRIIPGPASCSPPWSRHVPIHIQQSASELTTHTVRTTFYRSWYPVLSCPVLQVPACVKAILQTSRLGDDVLLIASRHHALMPHMSLCQDVYALDSTPAFDPGCMLLPLAASHVLLCMRCNLRVAKSMVIPAACP